MKIQKLFLHPVFLQIVVLAAKEGRGLRCAALRHQFILQIGVLLFNWNFHLQGLQSSFDGLPYEREREVFAGSQRSTNMERAQENLTYDAWLLLVTLDSQLKLCLKGILVFSLVQKVARRVSSFLGKSDIAVVINI